MLDVLATYSQKISLTLAVSLPFLVIFDASRNIDFQSYVCIVSGVFAWISIIINGSFYLQKLSRVVLILLAILLLTTLASALINQNISYGLFGAPLVRLGFFSIFSVIGIALITLRVSHLKLLTSIYSIIVLVCLISIPFVLIKYESFQRVGGIASQADIFACYLGVGILIGFYLLDKYKRYKNIIYISESLLFTVLILTQTRAVILLTILATLVWFYIYPSRNNKKYIIIGLVVLFVALVGSQLLPNRLTDISYAQKSIDYRLELNKYSLVSASTAKPFIGYGPGNLADALDCKNLDAIELKKTCKEGYFFNSSHNIFLDKIISIGWIGGLSYVALVFIGLKQGLTKPKDQTVLGLSLLLITGYYFTNVTSVVLELLFWIFIVNAATRKNETSHV